MHQGSYSEITALMHLLITNKLKLMVNVTKQRGAVFFLWTKLYLAYKCCRGTAPEYLQELIPRYIPARSLRSSSQPRLRTPRSISASGHSQIQSPSSGIPCHKQLGKQAVQRCSAGAWRYTCFLSWAWVTSTPVLLLDTVHHRFLLFCPTMHFPSI